MSPIAGGVWVELMQPDFERIYEQWDAPHRPQRYEAVNVLLASVFGDELLAIHHVGSTASQA